MPDITQILQDKIPVATPTSDSPVATTPLPLKKPLMPPMVEPTPQHPAVDLELKRSKEKLQRELETIHKYSPTFKIPPASYKHYLTYVARTIVQNALDRNMQLQLEKHEMYCEAVNDMLRAMYPLLTPALDAIKEAVRSARVASEIGTEQAPTEAKTLAFERAIIRQFHDRLALEFRHTEIDGRNVNKELVADCNAKLIRRVEFRKKRGSMLHDMRETVAERLPMT